MSLIKKGRTARIRKLQPDGDLKYDPMKKKQSAGENKKLSSRHRSASSSALRGAAKNVKNYAVSFVPQRVSGRTALGFMEFLRAVQPRRVTLAEGNLYGNIYAYAKHRERVYRQDGYIEDQENYTDLRYGSVTVSYAGCEVIAVANVLNALRRACLIGDDLCQELPHLLYLFEMNGKILGGRFGTSPGALRDYMKFLGFETWLCTDMQNFPIVAGMSDVLILTCYNDEKNLLKEVHTFCISKEDGYRTHNAYDRGKAGCRYEKFEDLLRDLNGGSAKPICLVGVRVPVNGAFAPGSDAGSLNRKEKDV